MSILGSTTSAEPKRLSDVIKYELSSLVCRENAILLAGDSAVRSIDLGAVLGKALFGAPTVVAGVGNTGAGVVGSMALKAGSQLGDYKLECITTATGAAVFALFDPAGNRLADATEGVAFANEQLGFTIGTDSTDTEYAKGDTHVITVPAGSGKLTAIDFTAVDGSQRAYGVATNKASAPDGVDSRAAVLVRGAAIINPAELVWPAAATDGQKAQALLELKAAGIIAVTAA